MKAATSDQFANLVGAWLVRHPPRLPQRAFAAAKGPSLVSSECSSRTGMPRLSAAIPVTVAQSSRVDGPVSYGSGKVVPHSLFILASVPYLALRPAAATESNARSVVVRAI